MPRDPRPQMAQVAASAWRVQLRDETAMEPSRRLRRVGRNQPWQEEVWRWYEELGEAWYSPRYVGRAMGLVGWRIVSGVDGNPTRGDSDEPLLEDTELLEAAEAALDELRGPMGTHAEWAEALGTCLGAVAEGYLVGYNVNVAGDPVAGEIEGLPNVEAVGIVWEATSPTELQREDRPGNIGARRRVIKMRRSADGDPVTLPDDTLLIRMWRPHPRWPDDPDSPFRPLLDVMEDLQIIGRATRGPLQSRVSSGLLLVPAEDFALPAGQVIQTGVDGAPENDVFTEIIRGLITPLTDPGSASAVVPTPITASAAHIDKWKHLDISRSLDELLPKIEEGKLRRFAQGLDLPPELVLGVGDTNHWGQWWLGEDGWRHVQWAAITIASGVTQQYLWPAVEAALNISPGDHAGRARVRSLRVGADPSLITDHPDLSADVDKAFDRGAISWAAYRRYKRFKAGDAPDDDELAERQRLGLLKTSDRSEGPATVVEGPPAQTASALSAMDFARRSAEIDSAHVREVLLLADATMEQMLSKAGARLRNWAGRDAELRRLVDGIDSTMVAMHLGPATVATLTAAANGGGIDQLFAAAVNQLLSRYRRITAAAQASWRRLVSDSWGISLGADEIERMTADALASEEVLRTGVTRVAEARLFDAEAFLSGEGEIPAGVTMPASVARRASAAAGGVDLAGGADRLDSWEGGLTTGRTPLDLLGLHGLQADTVTWVYGFAPRTSPYELHLGLDGEEFDGIDDPRLEGGPFGRIYPGDHNGCLCSLGRLYSLL